MLVAVLFGSQINWFPWSGIILTSYPVASVILFHWIKVLVAKTGLQLSTGTPSLSLSLH